MRNIACILLAVCFLFACNKKQTESVNQDGSSNYGEKIDVAGAKPAVEFASILGESPSKDNVKLVGEVVECCQVKGCWMTMAGGEDGEMIRVRFKDYGFFVPEDSPGKIATIEGKAFYDTTSVDMLRHYAVDGGMSEEEAEKTYTEPEVTLAFEAVGVNLKDKENETPTE